MVFQSKSSRHESRSCERHPADRHWLRRSSRIASAPQKHVWRAKIILATADGCATAESFPIGQIEARSVAMAGAVHDRASTLTRDKTRKPGLALTTVQRVVDLARLDHRRGIQHTDRPDALDRTQPGRADELGRAGPMTHDYKRITQAPVRSSQLLDGSGHRPQHAASWPGGGPEIGPTLASTSVDVGLRIDAVQLAGFDERRNAGHLSMP